MTLLQLLTQFTPRTLLALARTGRGRRCRRLTQAEIADKSGLSVKQIQRMARVNNWLRYDRGGIEKMLRLFAGCGVEPLHLHKHNEFLKRQKQRTS